MQPTNFFDDIPANLKEELFEKIIAGNKFTLERIVSDNHSSPDGFWYDQDKDEFVILLKGSAQLSYETGETIKLLPGDYIIIPAHKKHRVDWTDPDNKTIWLALHFTK